eukprot:GCRY01003194.1.p1 GENE.GCRY01003194.1~~GCRY01003194.1.p1  ORF type:complete len:774 (+),score=222.95 GCRY01003194.1:252-2573(+)
MEKDFVDFADADQSFNPVLLSNNEYVLKEREEMIHFLKMKIETKRNYVDLGLFILFLILLTWTAVLSRQVFEANLVDRALDDAIVGEEFLREDSHIYKSFNDIGAFEEFFQWLKGPFLGVLTADEWYNGDPFLEEESQTIYQYNKLMGGIRLRQLRVTADSCINDDEYKNYTSNTCFDYWSDDTNDAEPFGPGGKYVYFSEEETKATSYWGHISNWYSGGGYVVDIPLDANFTAVFDEIEADRWLDKQTRLVVITVNTFNPGVDNTVTQSKLILEVSPGGFIWLKTHIACVHLAPYVTGWDKFNGFLQVVMVIYFFYFVYKEVREFIQTCRGSFATGEGSVWKYFNGWNIYDWATIILFFVLILYVLDFLSDDDRTSFEPTDPNYIPLESIVSLYLTIYNIMAFVVLAFYLKVFKYLRLNRKMSLLWDTLAHARKDLVGFVVIFMVIVTSFSLMGFLVFGPEMTEFSTVSGSISALFRMMLGDAPFEEMFQVNRVLAPIYVAFFLILVFFTLLNIFLAILNDSWEKVHRGMQEETPFLLSEWLKKGKEKLMKMKSVQKLQRAVSSIPFIHSKRKQDEFAVAREDNPSTNANATKKPKAKKTAAANTSTAAGGAGESESAEEANISEGTGGGGGAMSPEQLAAEMAKNNANMPDVVSPHSPSGGGAGKSSQPMFTDELLEEEEEGSSEKTPSSKKMIEALEEAPLDSNDAEVVFPDNSKAQRKFNAIREGAARELERRERLQKEEEYNDRIAAKLETLSTLLETLVAREGLAQA